MQPFYQDDFFILYGIDCEVGMKELPENSIDLICTDPPYGLEFMGKDWDKAVPKVAIWKECLRVLKPGAFAFIMSAPRQDCLARMIVNLQDAGFRTDFTSIYWTFASGFPKAANISKMVDKQLGVEREVVGFQMYTSPDIRNNAYDSNDAKERDRLKVPITRPQSEQSKLLEGSYGGFQPKPALEVILVVMKPISKKTFVAQALDNMHGITWLDDCRIPYQSEDDKEGAKYGNPTSNLNIFNSNKGNIGKNVLSSNSGRFPSNLLVSDDILNDGNIKKYSVTGHETSGGENWWGGIKHPEFKTGYVDSGSFSRYFSLDAWWEERIKSLPESVQDTFPFLICPKPSKTEKNIGCEELEEKDKPTLNEYQHLSEGRITPKNGSPQHNNHPTVKSLKLMSYLIALGSRPGDTVLDPFIGSGTTSRACKMLNRKCIGFEIDTEQYAKIASHRQNKVQLGLL